jgi:hypothetical protein
LSSLASRLKLAKPVRVAVVLLAVAALSSTATAAAGADPAPLKVKVAAVCETTASGDAARFTFTFKNRTASDLRRVITMYRAGQELFEDDGFAPAGWSQLGFGPLPSDEWRAVVRSDAGVVLADRSVDCS